MAVACAVGLSGPVVAFAATTPSLGTATTFGILSSTFTRNVGLTAVGGDLGYTTLSGGGTNSLTGTLYVPSPSQAGNDQNAALANLNGQGCTFSFAAGAIDLAADSTHGTTGIYTPGVYCVTGAMSVGTAGITLNGLGTYIFRSTGALNTVDNSFVAVTGGASACDVFWTPVATTLGANATFIGTVIDNSGITVGNSTSWTGRALDFATTITTDTDTISVPSCGAPAPASFHVIKSVTNTGGGTATPSSFSIHVKSSGSDVSGSPQNGTTIPGTLYLLSAGTYTISEATNASYSTNFSGACDSSGNAVLTAGSDTTCTVTNTYIVPTPTSTPTPTPTPTSTPTPIPVQSSSGGGSSSGSTTYGCKDPNALNYNYFSASNPALCIYTATSTMISPAIATTTVDPIIIAITPTVIIPILPKTGFPPEEENIRWNIVILASVFALISVSLIAVLKNGRCDRVFL